MPNRPYSDSNVRLSGTPVYLGVIVFSGTSKTNSQTATPFNAGGSGLGGKVLLLQPSAGVYILPAKLGTDVVTATTGVKLATDERVIIAMEEAYPFIAAIQTSAGGNLSVWELV